MTNIPIQISGNKICYNLAGSRRDTIANITVLLPSGREIRPNRTYVVCIDIDDDIVAVKWYRSNLGRDYVELIDLRTGKRKEFDYIDNELITALLRFWGIGDDIIRRVLEWLDQLPSV